MAVASVQVATTQFFKTGGASTSVTGAVTVTAGANLLVVFTHNNSNRTCTGVTYNGTAMTEKGTKLATYYGTEKRVTAWYLVDPPTGASYNIVASFSGTAHNDHGFTWATYSGYSSLGTFYSNSSALNSTSADGSVTVSDWASGDYTVGSLIKQGTSDDVTAGDTEMGNYVSADNNDNVVSSEYTTADGVLNWTFTAEVWAACGFAIKGAAGGSVMPIIANLNMRRRA